uniref:Uncharacterized protein n=1 Tax=Romanomermis culicivorax TaxID=13658 RepID=A0A915JE93_ROMCU
MANGVLLYAALHCKQRWPKAVSVPLDPWWFKIDGAFDQQARQRAVTDMAPTRSSRHLSLSAVHGMITATAMVEIFV